MTEHGTTARYVSGCRCTECRHAEAVYAKTRLIRRQRAGGSLYTRRAPYQAALTAAIQAGITRPELATLMKTTLKGFYSSWRPCTDVMRLSTAQRLDKALRHAVAGHQQALQDVLDHLDAAQHPKDTTRWPAGALCGTITPAQLRLLSETDRRQVYRDGWYDTGRADRIALTLGLLPHEIWPDWHNQQETA